MTTPYNARILTHIIGNELARLIRDDTDVSANINPKVVQYGLLPKFSNYENLQPFIPAIFVKPDETLFEPLDMAGTDYEMQDLYRICLVYSFKDNTIKVSDRSAEWLDLIVRALRTDIKLSVIAGAPIREDGGRHQIMESRPMGTLYEPEEDILFSEAGFPVKAVVQRWHVRWLAR